MCALFANDVRGPTVQVHVMQTCHKPNADFHGKTTNRATPLVLPEVTTYTVHVTYQQRQQAFHKMLKFHTDYRICFSASYNVEHAD